MSEIAYWGNLNCPWSKTIGFIIIGLTIWDLWSFSQGDLLQDCSEQRSCTAYHMSLVHLQVRKFIPQKLKSVPFLEHLQEFHLDLCIPIYCRSPHMSCLWMISGRGWNSNFERSYILEYSEYKAEFWIKCSVGFYIQPLKFSASETSPT